MKHKHSQQEGGSEMVKCFVVTFEEDENLDTVNRAICLQHVFQTCTRGHLEKFLEKLHLGSPGKMKQIKDICFVHLLTQLFKDAQGLEGGALCEVIRVG